VETTTYLLGDFESSEVGGFRIVIEQADDFALNHVIIWYIYPFFVGKKPSRDVPFITQVSFYISQMYFGHWESLGVTGSHWECLGVIGPECQGGQIPEVTGQMQWP
jgi:hypothetical protein